MSNVLELSEKRKDNIRVTCINAAAKMSIPELEKRVDLCIDLWMEYHEDQEYDIAELQFVATEFARLLCRRKN